MSGVNQTTISDLESGRHTNPRYDTIVRLAKALRIPPAQLQFKHPRPAQNVLADRDKTGHAERRAI